MKKLVSILAISIFLIPVGSIASSRNNIRTIRGEDGLFQTQQNEAPTALKNREERKKSLNESLEKYKNAAQDKRLEALRNHGLNAIEVRLKVINNFANQIESNDKFDQDTKDGLMKNIQNLTNELIELKDKISTEQNIDQLKELVRSIHKDFKIFSIVKPRQSAIIAIARIQGVVNRLKNLEQKIESLIMLQKEKGKSTANLDLKLERLRENIVLTEEKINLAKQSFQKLSTDKEQTKAIIEEGKSYLLEARTLIKETGKLLREIIKELRNETEEEIKENQEEPNQVEQPRKTQE